MENRVNYTLIGLFVMILGIAAIIIPLWLTSGLDQQQYQPFMIHMNESVDGLSVNAPIKYNGVDVGYVHKINLDLKKPGQVNILVSIKKDAPITTHTIATLRERGITGVEYIGLESGKLAGAKPLIAKPNQPYPVILVSPSLKARLDVAIKQLMKNIDQMTQQIGNVMTPQNAKLLHQTLANMQNFTATLNTQMPQVQQSIKSFNALIQNLQQSGQSVPNILNNLQHTSQNLQLLSAEVRQNPGIVLQTPKTHLGPGEAP